MGVFGSRVGVEPPSCSLEETAAPTRIPTRLLDPGADPVGFGLASIFGISGQDRRAGRPSLEPPIVRYSGSLAHELGLRGLAEVSQ